MNGIDCLLNTNKSGELIMNTTKLYQQCVNTSVFNIQVWFVKSQDSMQSFKVATKLNESALGCEQAWFS